jgi:hypothetical protein
METPKLFISYSWSSPSHEQWVLDLASELRESGVDVILDKWDLKEGYDAVAFMEKMVTDPEIKKVVIVSDQIYSAKADGRSGGVGTETQIISKEVYENQGQDKFVAVVAQKDEVGKPCLPAYYKSRIYIDLSEPDKYGENFEKLLRWVFDKPLYVKPDLGKKPSFLNEGESISLGTAANFKRAVDAIRNNKPYALGALNEYLNTFAENLERFRIEKSEGEFDDAVVKSIEDFLPHRNEAIKLFVTISQYSANDENIQKMHRFFERLVPYMNPSQHVRQLSEWDFDNFIFIVHELFLYAVAVLIKHERFDQANFLMEQKYYMPGNSDYDSDVMVSFIIFRKYMHSLEHRNKRLELRRLSVRADLLKERCSGTGVEFRDLMQADFVLYLRDELAKLLEAEGDFGRWWPETLLCLGDFHSPFEIFARAVSKKYFDKVKCLLAIDSPVDLERLMNAYKEDKERLPRWELETFSPSALLGYDQLTKRP